MRQVIFVSGALANKPFNGGEAWVRLNWLLGLQNLGFDVFFIETIAPENCVSASGAIVPPAESINVAYFQRIVAQFRLEKRSVLFCHDMPVAGDAGEVVWDLAPVAVLFNISGHLSHHPLCQRTLCQVYIDIDPGFTQFWAADGLADHLLADHDFYFTIGENIGKPICSIPTGGIDWRATRQPVVLSLWPMVRQSTPPKTRFTTIAKWRNPYGKVWHNGRCYNLKLHQFRRFITIPEQLNAQFELALDIHPAEENDLQLLAAHGWQLVNPHITTATPYLYRHYIQRAGAEFSVAQGVYVDTISGWFSDRTACYLASGRPVLVQDSGFSHFLPVGKGLLTFRTMAEALAGGIEISENYAHHRQAARRLAERYFASDFVLGQLLTQIGVTLP